MKFAFSKQIVNSLVATLILALPQFIYAQPDVDQIIRKVAEQPTPKSSAVQLKMVLISQRGNKTFEQERSVEMFGLQTPAGSRSMLIFKEPKDVAGVSLLVKENKGDVNDQWLYMPALKQEPKRISGGQKNASFLGTDFTFADLEGRDPGNWKHKLLKEEMVEGKKTWVIESLPGAAAESQYSKTVQWIRQDIHMPIKIEFYDKKGLLKVLTVSELKQIDGYWIATKTKMHNVLKNHATELLIQQQKNNLDFPEDFFTTRRMKNG